MKSPTAVSPRLLSSSVLCALALLAPAGCVGSDDELMSAELESEDDDEATLRPSTADALVAGRDAGAFPGFGVDIFVMGDDVVLDWSGTSPAGNGVSVFRSQDAQTLADVDGMGAPPAGVDEIVLPLGTTQFVDVGAADHDQPTPDMFYRVVVATGGADGVSTMLMKKSTVMAPGYNKMGLCMLDGPTRASDMVAELGGSVTGVWAWDAASQSYVGWTPADGVGTAADYALPFGSVVAAQVDGSTPAYQSLVGTVPTAEALAVTAETGTNWQLFPILHDGPLSASYWVDVVGYMGMGMWNNLTQGATWYWGPQSQDFDVAPCQPYYSHQGADACTSSADCSADSYCDFAEAAACGGAAAGMCKARPIGCEFAPVQEVCGCDGQTYDSACEAELAGASVAAQEPCEEPIVEEQWVTGAWDWFNNVVVLLNADGTGTAANGFTCTWQVIDPEMRQIQINWNNGQFIDTLTLSADDNHLSGSNQYGHPVTGNRQL